MVCTRDEGGELVGIGRERLGEGGGVGGALLRDSPRFVGYGGMYHACNTSGSADRVDLGRIFWCMALHGIVIPCAQDRSRERRTKTDFGRVRG